MCLTSLKRVSIDGLSFLAKWEYETPSGSHKHRVYQKILSELAEEDRGRGVIDFSSGTGGVALAIIADKLGVDAAVVIPSQISREKKQKIRGQGARVIETPSDADYGYIESDGLLKARLHAARVAEDENLVFLDQANNPLNMEACRSIGREIIDQVSGEPDCFVCGVGTGGTISGVAAELLSEYSDLRVVGVEPAESNTVGAKLYDEEPSHGTHRLSGLGAGSRFSNLKQHLLDDIVSVTEQEWQRVLERLQSHDIEGGKSSAANVAAMQKIDGEHEKIVTVFCDKYENYASEFTSSSDTTNQATSQNEAWNQVYRNDVTLRTEPDPCLDELLDDFADRDVREVASVGCGDGINEEYLSEASITVHGYDISDAALEKAGERLGAEHLYRHDAVEAPLPSQYDAIIAYDLTMHLPDEALASFLHNMYESLTASGTLHANFLTEEDPNASNQDESLQDGIPIRFRSKSDIKGSARLTGLGINQIEPYRREDPPHEGIREEPHSHEGYLVKYEKRYNAVDEALEVFREGDPVIVLDHREQEGDLIAPAEKITAETVNFMLSHGRGVFCVSMLPKRFDELGVEKASSKHMNDNETRFGEPIDYLYETTTGVSAADRATTARSVTKDVDYASFRKNGHVRTLEANPDGVLGRRGHTESSIDLCRMCELYPAGVLIEILCPDGSMAREDHLVTFAEEHNMPIIKTGQIIHAQQTKDE